MTRTSRNVSRASNGCNSSPWHARLATSTEPLTAAIRAMTRTSRNVSRASSKGSNSHRLLNTHPYGNAKLHTSFLFRCWLLLNLLSPVRNICWCHILLLLLLLSLLKRSTMQSPERVLGTPYQLEGRSPTIPTHGIKEEKGKTGSEDWGPIKSISPALKTCQSHTIEHRVTKIVPQWCWVWNKRSAVLLGSAAKSRITINRCST